MNKIEYFKIKEDIDTSLNEVASVCSLEKRI